MKKDIVVMFFDEHQTTNHVVAFGFVVDFRTPHQFEKIKHSMANQELIASFVPGCDATVHTHHLQKKCLNNTSEVFPSVQANILSIAFKYIS